jgi:hypothetical protein
MKTRLQGTDATKATTDDGSLNPPSPGNATAFGIAKGL